MLRKMVVGLFVIASLSINVLLSYVVIQQYKVVQVVDGDTFQLASGKRVRLMGVDAPEYNRCGGPEAKKLLQSLILNSFVYIAEEQQEAYGRSLALIYTKAGLINRIILETGWGRPDYRKNSQRDTLTAAFHYASDGKKGIFSSLCRITSGTPQEPCFIKGNIDKNTYKKYYHLPTCKQYNQIVLEKDIGEQCFKSEEEAVKAGFTKSAGCPADEGFIKIPELGITIPFPKSTYQICPGYHPSKSLTFISSGSATIFPKDLDVPCEQIQRSKKYTFPQYSVALNTLDSGEEKYMEDSIKCYDTQTVSLFQNTIRGSVVDFLSPKKGCLPTLPGGTMIFIPFHGKNKIITITMGKYTGNELSELLTILSTLVLTTH